MRKELVLKLNNKILDVAGIFSNPDRPQNTLRETFEVERVRPVSESVALVTFAKKPTGKKALCVFFYLNSGEGYWQYFFPTDSHILGFRKIEEALAEIEQFNYEKNFEG